MAILNIQYRGDELKVIVDDDDIDRLSSYRWSATRPVRDGKANTYLRAFVNGKNSLLHRVILDAPRGLLVDHINGDTLDNRKENLRIVTVTENMWNRQKSSNSKASKYKGVYPGSSSWVAMITFNGTKWRSTNHRTEEDAAKAYNAMAQAVFGEHCLLNVIDILD